MLHAGDKHVVAVVATSASLRCFGPQFVVKTVPPVFAFADGQHVTLRFTAEGDENAPPPAQPPTSAASDGDTSAAALAEDEPELWSSRRTKFFLAQYGQLKDLVGKTRILRYVILCVQKLRAGCHCAVTANKLYIPGRWHCRSDIPCGMLKLT